MPSLFTALVLVYHYFRLPYTYWLSVTVKPNPEFDSFNHKYAVLKNGYRYHYVDEGLIENNDNDTLHPQSVILLVHGFPDLWYTWRHQIRYLSSKGYRVIAIDNLGHGLSSKPIVTGSIENRMHPTVYSTKNLVMNIIELLDQLKIEKVTAIGHDWGSNIVWRMGLYSENRIQAVISVGNPMVFPEKIRISFEDLKRLNPEFMYFSELADLKTDRLLDTVSNTWLDILFNNSTGNTASDRAIYHQAFAVGGYHGPLNYYRTMQGLNHEDEQEFVGQTYQPKSLMIHQLGDKILNPAYTKKVVFPERFKDLTEVDIEKGDHFILTENPEAVNQVLGEFLEQVYGKDMVGNGSNGDQDIKDVVGGGSAAQVEP